MHLRRADQTPFVGRRSQLGQKTDRGRARKGHNGDDIRRRGMNIVNGGGGRRTVMITRVSKGHELTSASSSNPSTSDAHLFMNLDVVTDVVDALILNRFFGYLFSNGVILVSTSNRAPYKLYEGGLQRDLFLPFISTLKERCVVHEIGSSVDYRKMTSAEQGFYFVGKEPSGFLKQKFQQLVGEHKACPQQVAVVPGRILQVPLGANGCAYFPFEEL